MFWIIVLIFISLATSYYFNQKAKIRKEERLERLQQKQEALLEMVRRKKNENES